MADINTQNDFLISSNGATLAPLLPVNIKSRQEAYRTAAWIVGMAIMLPLDPDDPTDPTFEEVRDAIANT